MKKSILIIMIAGLMFSCTKDNFNDTGISNGVHDCTMLEYFKENSENWDSLIIMINHAQLIDLFSGKDAQYKDITFLGITNHSIRRYMLTNSIVKVTDMSSQFCKQMLLLHIIPKRIMKADINFRIPDSSGAILNATEVMTVGGVNLLFYREKSAWGGVADAGPVTLFLRSVNADAQIPLASPDIVTNNGVVHALNYNYTLGDIISEEERSAIEALNE